jgi:hypothetical protein
MLDWGGGWFCGDFSEIIVAKFVVSMQILSKPDKEK